MALITRDHEQKSHRIEARSRISGISKPDLYIVQANPRIGHGNRGEMEGDAAGIGLGGSGKIVSGTQ